METSLMLPENVEHEISAINNFQKLVHKHLVEGADFGVIPGTTKPTLLKPGAEKIAKLLGLSDQYEIVDKKEDWTDPGFFRYLIKCKLSMIANSAVISEGLGECNSKELKYRWRVSKQKCPICGTEAIIKGKEEYGGGWVCFKKQGGCGANFKDNNTSITGQTIGRVENDDIYSQVNTILKMAKKRSLVDAVLSAGRLSEVFTQDLDDIPLPKGDQQKPGDAPKSEAPKTGTYIPPETDTPTESKPGMVTEAQRRKLFAVVKENGWTTEDVHLALKGNYNLTSTSDLTVEQASELIEKFSTPRLW